MCLAASGGGHLRQLLDLEAVWSRHDYFLVTEDTALGRSLAERHPTRFVDHYALGQARLGHPFKMAAGGVRNFFQSLRILRAERPDVVLTTGAGAVFFVALFARLFLGAKLVLIESFARFDHPSAFGRMIAPFATVKVVQSPALKARWPDAELFDPFRLLDGKRPPKRALTFATVGATLPFPRLVEAVLKLKKAGGLDGELILQVGEQHVEAGDVPGLELVESLPFERIQEILSETDLVICHGGTGSLVTALRAGCRVVAFPRRHDLGEHYDDHQEEISQTFADRGLLQIVRDETRLADAIAAARATEPVMATTDHTALMGFLTTLLERWRKG
jgi:UDP-N-acetylglucosamine transferase subunit ALG13